MNADLRKNNSRNGKWRREKNIRYRDRFEKRKKKKRKKTEKVKGDERRNRRKWRNLKIIKTAGDSPLYRRTSGRSGRRRAPYRKKGLAFPKRRPLKTDYIKYSSNFWKRNVY
jgi:hypothetical protein